MSIIRADRNVRPPNSIDFVRRFEMSDWKTFMNPRAKENCSRTRSGKTVVKLENRRRESSIRYDPRKECDRFVKREQIVDSSLDYDFGRGMGRETAEELSAGARRASNDGTKRLNPLNSSPPSSIPSPLGPSLFVSFVTFCSSLPNLVSQEPRSGSSKNVVDRSRALSNECARVFGIQIEQKETKETKKSSRSNG